MADDIEELADSIDDGEVVFIVAPSGEVDRLNTGIVRHYTSRDGICIYVNVSKPYNTLEKRLREAGAKTENVFYVDCVTALASVEVSRAANAVFLRPSDLTDISFTIENTIETLPENRERILLVDTLSAFQLYNDEEIVSKFAHRLMTRLHDTSLKSILLAISEETEEQMMSQMQQFADRVVRFD